MRVMQKREFGHTNPTPDDIRRWVNSFRLAGWAFLGLTILLTWGVYRYYTTAQSTNNWPFVTGEVLEFDIRSRPADTSVFASIRYSYTVDGFRYTGSRFSVDNSETGVMQVARRLDAYPEGRSVTVYYDPENPSSAVLEPGISVNSLVVTSMAYIFFVLLVLALSGICFRLAVYWDKKLEDVLEIRTAALPLRDTSPFKTEETGRVQKGTLRYYTS
jgi:hypothetical protein